MKMTKPNSAETVALQALAWLAGNEELLPVFQGASGAGADDLRNGATDPAFLGSVLDFVMMDDVWVVAFVTALACPMTPRCAPARRCPAVNR